MKFRPEKSSIPARLLTWELSDLPSPPRNNLCQYLLIFITAGVKHCMCKHVQATDFFNLKEILGQLHRYLELLFNITNISSFVLEGINELAQERFRIQRKLAHRKAHSKSTVKHLEQKGFF